MATPCPRAPRDAPASDDRSCARALLELKRAAASLEHVAEVQGRPGLAAIGREARLAAERFLAGAADSDPDPALAPF